MTCFTEIRTCFMTVSGPPTCLITNPIWDPNMPSFLIDMGSDENTALSQMRSGFTGAACLREPVGVSGDHFA